MRTKASYLFILLLCAVVQGAWAQNAEVKFIQKSWNEESSTVVNTELSGSHSEDWPVGKYS